MDQDSKSTTSTSSSTPPSTTTTQPIKTSPTQPSKFQSSSSSSSPTTPTPTSSTQKNLLPVLTFLLLALTAVGLIAGYYYFQNQNKTLVEETTPIATTSATKKLTTKWIYERNYALYLYDQQTNQETTLTPTASQTNAYRDPQFVTNDIVSYLNIVRETENGPYSYHLIKHDLNTNQTTTLLTTNSYPNENNYPVGGEITAHTWRDDQQQLAYFANLKTDTSVGFSLHLLNPNTKQDLVLQNFKQAFGRGGSLDDQVKITYSPDNSKLLLTATFLIPPVEPSGSTHIYDLKANPPKTLWSHPSWTTFGFWLDNNNVAAKQLVDGGANIVNIKPNNPNSTTLVKSFSGYNFHKTGSDSFIYFDLHPTSGLGFTLNTFDLTTKSKMVLASNLMPLKLLNDNILAVSTYGLCEPDECAMDALNGYTHRGLALFNLSTKETIKINLPSSENIFDLDVIAN